MVRAVNRDGDTGTIGLSRVRGSVRPCCGSAGWRY